MVGQVNKEIKEKNYEEEIAEKVKQDNKEIKINKETNPKNDIQKEKLEKK